MSRVKVGTFQSDSLCESNASEETKKNLITVLPNDNISSVVLTTLSSEEQDTSVGCVQGHRSVNVL